MAWPSSLQVALKEWASVCRAMEHGTQLILLRKGGIYEAGGQFKLQHREFLLFPTYLHQNIRMLKPAAQADLQPCAQEPQQVHLSSAGVVTDILQLKSRQTMDALDDEHIWTAPLLDMRFSYRPENPLYLLLVRLYRLREARPIDNTPAYAGCKSWVPLDQSIATGDATAALDDVRYEFRRQSILKRIAE